MSVASEFTAIWTALPCRSDWRIRADRFVRAIGQSRPQRVALLLAAIWIMQYCDLRLTLFAHEHGMLGETNPIARRALDFGPAGAAVYKFALLCGATGVLLGLRRHRLTEYLLWAAVAVFIGLSFYWHACLAVCEDCWGQYTYCRMYLGSHLCQIP